MASEVKLSDSEKKNGNRNTCDKIFGERIRHFLKRVTMKFHVVVVRGTQREYSSKPLKHSSVKRILLFKQ